MPLKTTSYSYTLFSILFFFLVPQYGCSNTNAVQNDPRKPITISVYPDQILREIPPEIFGSNIEWFNNGNGFWQQQYSKINPNLSELMADQNVSLVRFPGGTFSDFYNWQDGIGPLAVRPVRPHRTDPGSSANFFGSPELLSLCKSTSSSALITVNVGTGTSQLAAGWVDYMNNPNNLQRKRDGHSNPLPVRFWEVGNELYLNGSEAEKEITMKPEKYADKFLEYAVKMRTTDPSIKLIALGVSGAYTVPFGPYNNWNKTVLEKAGKEIDFMALHNSYAPMLIDMGRLSMQEVYQTMWGAPLAIENDLNNLGKLITTYEGKKPIGIAITEWGPFFSTDPKLIDHVKTLGASVFVARVLQVFISHSKVKIANYFKFTDNSFMGWVDYEGQPKVPYYAFQMYSKYFGTQLVKSEVNNSPFFKSNKAGLTKAQEQIPEINVVAATNEKKDKLYINIVSSSWDQPRTITLDLQGFPAKENAIKRSISGSSPLSNNGPDLPQWWPLPYDEPEEKQKESITIETSSWKLQKKLVIPPHSVTTIELSRDS